MIDAMRRVIATVMAALMATMGLMAVQVVAAPSASAAGALVTVPNGISTTDLTAVGMSPTALAQQLAGTGVSVSNVTYSGAPTQAGRIHVTDPAVVSFNDGVILSSGTVADILGPNKSDSTTGDMNGPGDADLTALIANTQTVYPATYDASVLEFDFVPAANQIYFTYTFGSDEYLEWVNLFNDVFGFFVNGVNCATVAGGASVSIDTINSNVNSNLFRDNAFSTPLTNPINIESDGLSVELICSAPVNAGKVNHMKLAIADTSDRILDSVVMIKANSLSTVKPESCNNGVDDNSDSLVDMNDPKCQATTTPAPPKAKGVGSSGNFPAFTGNEGGPILLDASVLGWQATPDTVRTTWEVTGINGTTGTCSVDPAGPVALQPDGSITAVDAYCPNDGEYVAHVWGWDAEGNSPFDYDVDFFVHNAPPEVSIDTPLYGDTPGVGDTVELIASVVDPGASDTITCSIAWGDGVEEAAVLDQGAGTCSGSHVYDGGGQTVITVTATDGQNASAASKVVLDVQGPSNLSAPVVTKDPASVTVAVGATASFSALAEGKPSPTVQWQKLTPGGVWTPIAGATKSTYALPVTKTLGGVQYRAVFSNSLGTATTAPAAINLVAVSKFVPNSGGVGTSVTVTGTNLLGVSAVTIGGAAAPFLAVSPTQVLVSVPSGATTGPLVVTTAAGPITAKTFAVSAKATAPTITGFTPGITRPGNAATVLLSGTNLVGTTSVKLGTVALEYTVLAANQLRITIPATGVGTGALSVTTAGGTVSSSSTFRIADAPTQIAAGLSHSCARLADGTVRCWGLNTNGQLGDGTTTQRTSPVAVSGLTDASSVATGTAFSCAVINAGPSGTVRCWGLNTNGQLGDGTTTQRTSPVAVSGLSGVTAVTVGDAFACALLSNGSIRCWGANASGQLGDGTTTQRTTPVSVASLSGVALVDAGGASVCARLTSGALRCWGQNSNGQLGNGASTTAAVTAPVAVLGIDGTAAKAASVSVGSGFACAVMVGGGMRCWGLNSSGQLGDGTTVQRTSPVAVLTAAATPLTGVTTLSAGRSHVCAIAGSAGTVTMRCWGSNASGQFGAASPASSNYAMVTAAFTDPSAVACGGSYTLVLMPSSSLGTLVAASGSNTNGQLGDGTTTKRTTPVVLSGL